MKSADIRELTDQELQRTLNDNRHELFNLRLQSQTGQLENTARIRLVRRDIARLETEVTARRKRQTV